MSARIYVVGAGLAGLVAAEHLASRGGAVTILEASPKAGGRCRSYRDDRLGRVIDNGNHLILSANTAVLGWADRIGGADRLRMLDAAFPYLDLDTGARWSLELGRGPFAALSPRARAPGTPLGPLLRDMVRLMTGPARRPLGRVVRDRGAHWRTFWDPLTRAVLNEPPEGGDAGLMRATLMRSFAKGGGTARPVVAPDGLGAALIEPALDRLERAGATIRYRTAVQGLSDDGSRVTGIHLRDADIRVGPGDRIVLALPPAPLAAVLPDLPLPAPGGAIANAHFVVPGTDLPPILAVLGATTQWVFRRGDVVSVTVSAAEDSALDGMDRAAALDHLWGEMRAILIAHGCHAPRDRPAARFLREKAATFDQTPDGVRRRASTTMPWANLFLAGDHTDTGLPATLEGAVLSGQAAGRAALD
ncbi:hydroxysqualene dehydroxylase HpnE [Jannaschia sp. LMIT008]|uniref:hydroxysqualene dehydroxylase HpnE n=1 Tax=Jannaschia maritima TaxID=3032585 RepID=UPI002811B0E0|nr:hydroxysqualene dehydroxylase HpnE [Jannaschia sp. LMIT008]